VDVKTLGENMRDFNDGPFCEDYSVPDPKATNKKIKLSRLAKIKLLLRNCVNGIRSLFSS